MTYIDPLLSISRGQAFVDDLFTGQANRQAGARLQQGDYRGASSALYANGNIDGGRVLQAEGRAQDVAARERQTAGALRVVRALREARTRGQDLGTAFDSYSPFMAQLGLQPNDAAQIRQTITSNPDALDEYARVLGEEADSYDFREINGDLIATNKRTLENRTLIDNPDRPIFSNGAVFLPPSGGMAAGSPGQSAPVTGAAISAAPLYNPADMVGITAQAESGGRETDPRTGRRITSPAGAEGIMQVMPGTQNDPGYGVRPSNGTPEDDARVGRDYLAAMMREYGNDPAKAWAAYNWGPGNLDRAIARYGGDWLSAAPAETQQYVQNNLRALNGGAGAVEEQGDQSAPASGVQQLAGGWTMQQFQTPADRRAERAAEREEIRFQERNNPTPAQAEQSTARTFTQENQLRQSYGQNASVKALATVRPQVGLIGDIASRAARGEEISAQDDLALIFAYMKILDPDSVVREGEFANAQNTGGIPDRIVNLYNNALRGTRLNDNQRSEFFRSANRVITQYQAGADAAATRQRELAQSYGLDPDRVAPAPRQRERQETTPRLRFQPTEAQTRRSQEIVRSRSAQGPRGSATNPILINPAQPTQSYNNIRPGQYYIDPTGQVRRRQ